MGFYRLLSRFFLSTAISLVAIASTAWADGFAQCTRGETTDWKTEIHRLVAHLSPNATDYPTISIIRSKQLNAYTPNHKLIALTEGMLSMLQSTGELAFVIAHEIAHWEGENPYGRGSFLGDPTTNSEEYAADQSALKLLKAANLDTKDGIVVLQRLAGNLALGPSIRTQLNGRASELIRSQHLRINILPAASL